MRRASPDLASPENTPENALENEKRQTDRVIPAGGERERDMEPCSTEMETRERWRAEELRRRKMSGGGALPEEMVVRTEMVEEEDDGIKGVGRFPSFYFLVKKHGKATSQVCLIQTLGRHFYVFGLLKNKHLRECFSARGLRRADKRLHADLLTKNKQHLSKGRMVFTYQIIKVGSGGQIVLSTYTLLFSSTGSFSPRHRFKTLVILLSPSSPLMATSKLKVDELRDELSKRGLSTAGIKPTLVKRLDSAIRKESVPVEDSNNRLEKRKREESEDGDFKCESPKIRAIEDLRKLSIKQLREQASVRGISTTGSKKELIERLCNDSQTNTHDIIEEIKEEEDTNENKKEKIVTATKKGSAVLDQYISDHIKSQYHVLHQGVDIYDATLNQTNVGENNNKFYIIQALESDSGSSYMVYNRWGRVGIKGQDKLHGPYTNVQSAIDEFEQKFHAKTKNFWSNRKDFVSHPKSYTWLEMDYNEAGKETVVQEKIKNKLDIQPRETKLEARVAKFISLICNVSMMKQQMMEIGYNAEKLPLGKLSKATISKGYEVLKRVADVIGQHDRKKLEQLSGEFYTIIPHDFGFKKMREFVIDTPQKLKRKLEMVEALGEIEVATKLLEDNGGTQEDPLLSRYESLHCELTPVEFDSKEFHMIEKYMKNTHANTHSNYTVEIVQILRTSRHGETDRFNKFSNNKNRMLLWHGSRLSNWTGILSQGLRIAPPEAPVTGYMFGKGVYFADMFSKSANYCCASQQASAGVLLLCEVALGEMAELLTADHNADKLPQGKLSTKGVGATAPDMSEIETLEDGVVVPLGKPKQQLSKKASLLYNEYITYNVDQIRMRYVVHVNFNFK